MILLGILFGLSLLLSFFIFLLCYKNGLIIHEAAYTEGYKQGIRVAYKEAEKAANQVLSKEHNLYLAMEKSRTASEIELSIRNQLYRYGK